MVHPKFKLDWLDDDGLRIEITTLLKNALTQLCQQLVPRTSHRAQEGTTTPAAMSTSTSSTDNSATLSSSNNFFARLAAKRSTGRNSIDIGQEVEKCLTDPSSEVQSLQLYPNIRKLYVKLNTGLPSSASVERLFSLRGRVFTPLRSRLNGTHFKMMTFMCAYSSCN